jgi:hypothetical protein
VYKGYKIMTESTPNQGSFPNYVHGRHAQETMHPRIKELAKQAGLKQTKWADAETGVEPVRIWQESLNDPGALERFAELIVKECNQVIYDGSNPSIFYQHRILRHFGIEND